MPLDQMAFCPESGKGIVAFGHQNCGKLALVDAKMNALKVLPYEYDCRVVALELGESQLGFVSLISAYLVAISLNDQDTTQPNGKLWELKLSDVPLSLVYHDSRLFAALANGSLAVIENAAEKAPSFLELYYIPVGPAPISTLAIVNDQQLWCGMGSKAVILSTKTLDSVEHLYVASSSSGSCVSFFDKILCFQPASQGVWLVTHHSSVVQLWDPHTYTCRLLFDISNDHHGRERGDNADQEAQVTSLLCHDQTLWVGTACGYLFMYEIRKKHVPTLPINSGSCTPSSYHSNSFIGGVAATAVSSAGGSGTGTPLSGTVYPRGSPSHSQSMASINSSMSSSSGHRNKQHNNNNTNNNCKPPIASSSNTKSTPSTSSKDNVEKEHKNNDDNNNSNSEPTTPTATAADSGQKLSMDASETRDSGYGGETTSCSSSNPPASCGDSANSCTADDHRFVSQRSRSFSSLKTASAAKKKEPTGLIKRRLSSSSYLKQVARRRRQIERTKSNNSDRMRSASGSQTLLANPPTSPSSRSRRNSSSSLGPEEAQQQPKEQQLRRNPSASRLIIRPKSSINLAIDEDENEGKESRKSSFMDRLRNSTSFTSLHSPASDSLEFDDMFFLYNDNDPEEGQGGRNGLSRSNGGGGANGGLCSAKLHKTESVWSLNTGDFPYSVEEYLSALKKKENAPGARNGIGGLERRPSTLKLRRKDLQFEDVGTPSFVADQQQQNTTSNMSSDEMDTPFDRRNSYFASSETASVISVGSSIDPPFPFSLTLQMKLKIADKPVKCLVLCKWDNDKEIILSCAGNYGDEEAILKWTKESKTGLWINDPIVEESRKIRRRTEAKIATI